MRAPDKIHTNCRRAMRGFDSLPAEVRAALNDEPTVSVPLARRFIKNMGAERAAKHIEAMTIMRLSMQRTFTTKLKVSA